MSKNYYDILGIGAEASDEEIKKAYRQLAMQWHPDRHADPAAKQKAEERFKEISEAYSVLGDAQKKRNYDLGGSTGSFSDFDPFTIFTHATQHFEDIFSRPRNIEVSCRITLEELTNGVVKELNFEKKEICTQCKGAGGSGTTCRRCGGYGKLRQSNAFSTVVFTCDICQGRGTEIAQPCQHCQQGYVRVTKSLKINIPPGTNEGTVLRVRGEGEKKAGRQGDLHCVIHVDKHEQFTKQNLDLIYSHEMSFLDACFDSNIEVPTIRGKKVKITIPAGSQYGDTFRIKGEGIPDRNRHRCGDQIVVLKLTVPKILSQQSAELLKQIRDLS